MLGRVLLRGLFAVLPIVITVALLIWLFRTIESAFAFVLRPMLGEHYVTGMGLALGLVVVLAAGVAMGTWFVRKLVAFGERQLMKLPLVKTLYGSVQDMLSLFSGSRRQDFNQVVTVRWGDQRLLGFVTRQRWDDLPAGIAGDDEVAVYLPMSYQLGGFTVMVRRDQLQTVDMSLEEAMKFAITAGVSAQPQSHDNPAPGATEAAPGEDRPAGDG